MTTTLTPARTLALAPVDTMPTVLPLLPEGAEIVDVATVLYNGKPIGTLVKFTRPGAWEGTDAAIRWAVIDRRNPRSSTPRVERTRKAALTRHLDATRNLLAVEVASLVEQIEGTTPSAAALDREAELRMLARLDVESRRREGAEGHIRHLNIAIPDNAAAPFGGMPSADDVAIVERIVGGPLTWGEGNWAPYNATLRSRLRRWAMKEAS